MEKNNLTKIDPAFDSREQFAQLTQGTSSQIQAMRASAIFKDGKVPAKYKILAATLWAISAKCEPCIIFYIQQAKKHGVSKEELGEFLAVANTMGGCVGEMWALKAFHAYQEGKNAEVCQYDSCCHTEE